MNRIPFLSPAPAVAALSPVDDNDRFYEDVVKGLSAAQKSLPCKYFYDDAGCQLFEAICRTPEYYVTRTEMQLLNAHAAEIAALIGPGAQLIEFGGSASTKARVVLDAMDTPAAYVPIDVCTAGIYTEMQALSARYPGLDVRPVTADFTQSFDIPETRTAARRVGFFPGSTIGNFAPTDAGAFLRHCARLLGRGGLMIIGVDLKKSSRLLDEAYNDAGGVTAAFNLNLLQRINRELKANFDLDAFTHHANFNAAKSRIEMHLYSLAFQSVCIRGHQFSFTPGEAIHTENSYKYEVGEFLALAREGGYAPLRTWRDADNLFSVHCLEVVAIH